MFFKASLNKSTFYVLGLSLILLIAPCQVRNFIQAQLEVPQTKVFNKNKATNSNVGCYGITETVLSEAKIGSSKSVNHHLIFDGSNCVLSLSIKTLIKYDTFTSSSSNAASVALYILYSSLKICF